MPSARAIDLIVRLWRELGEEESLSAQDESLILLGATLEKLNGQTNGAKRVVPLAPWTGRWTRIRRWP